MNHNLPLASYIPGFIRRSALGALLCVLFSFGSFAQTDTEFWFVVPDITLFHPNTGGGGIPAYFRFASGDLPANVTITMPANEFSPSNPDGFVPITFSMAANAMHSENVSNLIAQQIAGVWTDMNKLENKPLTADGINKFGLKIVSDNDITAYFESGNAVNKDLYALKGKNALGTEFYTPFQTWSRNRTGTSEPHRAYSAIDIVATEDGTIITFKLKNGIAASYGGPGASMTNIIAGGTHTITLNQGETFSLFPLGKSILPTDRLVGTRITSNRPIAVTIKDDSVYHGVNWDSTGSNDQYGDQLVPTSIIGKEYAIINTGLRNPHDDIYVLATQDGTTASIDGVDYNLDAGDQQWVRFPSAFATKRFIRVISDKPVYVLHIGGAVDAGDVREVGGAILPPIDKCTGSTKVSFVRSYGEPFTIILMVRKGAEGNFRRFVNGLPRTMPALTWYPLPAPSEWSVTRIEANNTTDYPVNSSQMFENTEDIFHLGILNGNASGGAFYGYFSDFNELKASGVVAGTATQQFLFSCFGETVQLYAKGGTEYKWYQDEFDPAISLNDDEIHNPFANPTTNTNYKVVVSGACNMKDSAYINVQVSTQIIANFTTDVVAGCAPLDVTFSDNSTGVYSWQYNMGDGSDYYRWDLNAGTATIPDPPTPFEFTHTFNNTTNAPIEYTITLLARNNNSCSDIYTKRIVVYPQINASYTQANVSANPLCANPLEVRFTNTSSSNTDNNYYWNFGDGFNRVSDVHNEVFTHNFTNTELTPKTFDIEMVAVSPEGGCRDTATSQVTVTSFYEPSFTLDKTNGCGPLTVNVTNTSAGDIVAYSWTLSPLVAATPADGSNFTLNLQNLGSTPIVYELSLTVTNSSGCSKTSDIQQITVYPYVSTGFDAPAQVCNNTPVAFSNNTTTTNPSTYSWDFGDGAGSSLVNPSHTYNNTHTDLILGYINHTYNVTLTVTNPWGCSNSFSRNIEVGALNEPDFVLFPAEGCSPLEVTFQNNSLGHPSFTRVWSFSDGSPNSNAITPPNRTFINNGTTPLPVTVRYTATNGMGCSDFVERNVVVYPKVNVDFSPKLVTICDSVQVNFAGSVTPALPDITYSWSFGDGATGMGSNTSHIFRNFGNASQTYTTTLVARSEFNCIDIENTTVTVSPNIKALFSASRAEICSGESITFTYHRMGSIQNYSFVFVGYTDNVWPGDASALGSFTKTFTNNTNSPMPITVRLTVSNGDAGCNKVYEIPIVVNPAITPNFTWSDNGNPLGCEPLNATFTNTTTYTGGGAFTGTYSWNFGDGASSAEVSPNHTFYNNSPSAAATYTVTLTVTSEHGCVATAPTQDIEVQPRLKAGFTFDQSSSCTPFNVTFNPGSSVGATQYHWSYDGAIPPETLATNAPFTRAFTNTDPNSIATYNITLTVENTAGCTDVLTRTIEVYPEVIADFVNSGTTPLSGCSDHTITFENQSTGGSLTFIWDFGDGTTYTTTNVAEDVTHTFTNIGTTDIPYTVRLTAINPNGCSTFRELTVTVHPKVEANFSIASVASCVSTTSPFVLNVSAPAIANINYSWTFNGETSTGTNPVFSPITENKTGANEYYNIVLTATGTGLGSCTAVNNTQTVTIYPEVQAQWNGDLTAQCSPASLNLTNTSDLFLAANPVTNVHWQVFDVANTLVASSSALSFTPTLLNNSHTAQSNFNIRITATSADGCVGMYEESFTVNPEPLARFNVNITEQCTPVEIQVVDQSTTIANGDYTWDWDGGTEVNTSGQNYTVTYQNDTEVDDFKHISLTLENQYNCTSSYDYLFTVTPKVNAIISGASVDQICGSEIITFSNASTGGIHRYNWDFGDGNKLEIDSKGDVSHTFINNGLVPLNRVVTLTATNSIGCTNDVAATYNIVVYPRVVAAQSFTLGDICGGQVELNLNNASTNKDVVVLSATNTFEWQFTTADAGGASQVFTPADANPVLGNTDRINPVTYNLNFLAQSVWNYNGNPTHTCVDNVTGEDVVVYPNLVPVYNSPLAECSGQTGVLLTFTKDDANSSGGGVGDVTLEWNFGDGNTQSSTYQSVSHTFLNLSNVPFITPTTATATQIATGCTAPVTVPVTVYPRVSAAQSFTLGDLCGGEVDITLVNASSNTAVTHGSATNRYEWRFTTGDPNGVPQTFTGAGNYSLQNIGAITPVTYSLEFFAETVWNIGTASEESCSDVINPTTQVVVYPNLIPVYAAPDPECSGQTGVSLTFVKQGSSSGGDVNDVALVWNFGDGNTQSSTFQSVSHTFLNLSNVPFITPTTATATQIATGCTAPVTVPVTVYPRVSAAQSFTLGDLCGGEVDITLVNASSNTAVTHGSATNRYEWRFTTGDPNGVPQTFTGAGNYSLQNIGAITPVTYSLEFFAETVWNIGTASEESCSDVINPTTQVVVYPELIPVYAAPDSECSGQSGVSLTFVKQGSSSGGDVNDVALVWNFGDGNTQSSTFQSVSHTFLNLSNVPFITPTTATATQIATGCTAPVTVPVTVYPRVSAAQSFTLGDLCGGEVDITLVNASSNTAVTHGSATNRYEWRFTPNDAVNGVAQTFTSAGNYSLQNTGAITPVTYSLEFFAETVWNIGTADEKFCSDVINPTTQVVVYPELIPVYAAPDSECSGQSGVSLTFVKQGSSSGGDVNDVALVWNFGDGNTQSSTFQSVSHTFLNLSNVPFITPTTATATQIATGCTAPVTVPVTVYPRVSAAQSFTLGDLCGGEVDITLVNASSNTAVTHVDATNRYEWRFTTGDPNGVPQTFTGAGNYSLQNIGAITPVTYSLEFFAETVWNIGTADEKFCSDVINPTTQVVVYPELIPIYAAPDPECSGQSGVSLTFVKQGSSSGGDVNDVALVWNFGDGNTQSSTFQSVSHTFLNLSNVPFITPTTATATQIATGCTAPVTVPVTVYPRVTAVQSFVLGDLCDGTVELTLSNGSSNLGVTHADATNSYQWVFTPNDITNGVAQTISTTGTYSLVNNGAITPVVYSLQFTAQTAWADGNICDHNITGQNVTVYPNLNPIYEIPPAICSGLTGATLEFVKNAASSGGGISDVSIQWDFSDGNTRTTTFDPTVSKLFTNLGDVDFTTRTKILATQLATGCTAYREIDVLVHPKVESIFAFEKGDECLYPLPVTFSNASKFAASNPGVTTTFHWDYDYEWAGTWQEDTRTSSASHTYSFYNAQPNAKVDYDITLAIQQLHTVSGLTCSNSSTRTITVYPELIATFNLPVIEGCNPLTVSFDDNSTGVLVAEGGRYQWTFGDGTGSTNVNPIDKIYGHSNRNQSVNYPIGLTITNPLGCQKSHSGSIEVYPLVVSSFNVAQVEGCTPLDVNVSNTSTSNAYVYQWNFQNGLPANATSAQPGTVRFVNTLAPPDVLAIQKPTLHLQTALNQSVYPVGNGCAETHEAVVTVFPHVYPSFDADLQDCHPLKVDFDNTTHIFGGTSNGSYRWNFGNGVQSNFENYSQIYLNTSLTSNRTFDGKLYAQSEHGCTDSIDFQVVVFPKPQSRMELADYMDCSPFDMQIQNLSVGKNKGSTLRFDYNFGDGADSTTYSADIMNHRFRNTSNNIQPYMISLYVETEDGCSDFSSQTIQVYPEVTAHFNFRDNIDENCNPFNVQFDNNSVNAWYYEWDFNDGASSYLYEPVYRFVNNTVNDRTYYVELTAISEFDCEDTYTLPLTVFAAPIVDYAIYPPLLVYPEARFEFRNQSRPGNMPANWIHHWEYGDGYTNNTQSATHQHEYETWGPRTNNFKYTTALTIDNGKCSDTKILDVTLLPPEPVSVFKADRYQSCSPLIVNFTNEAEYYYTSQEEIAFEWRVNDVVFSNEAEPSYTFVEPGYYNVSLSVYGDGGEKHFYQTFRVFENPVANFEALPEKVTLPNAKVHFFNLSQKGDRYHWYFGDGDYSTDKDPVHIYNEIGEYRVSLTAYATYDYNGDVYECIDISSKFPAVWVTGTGRIRFPNAFVPSKLGPNGGYYDAVDYKNEVFHPVAEGVVEYKLLIFNRWGEQIFESNDIKIGWDGYYKGKLANQDVYVWRAIGRFSNGQMFDERGNVTLLR